MPLAKCVRCNNLFDKTQNAVCPQCIPEEEEDFEKIRECLIDHADLGPEAVAELSGVDLPVVLRMLEQGLVTSTASLESVVCGRCGAPAISPTKKLCHSCLEKLNQKIAQQRKEIEVTAKKTVEVGAYSSSVRQAIEQKRR